MAEQNKDEFYCEDSKCEHVSLGGQRATWRFFWLSKIPEYYC